MLLKNEEVIQDLAHCNQQTSPLLFLAQKIIHAQSSLLKGASFDLPLSLISFLVKFQDLAKDQVSKNAATDKKI